MTLDTAHKAPNTLIDTGHESRLVYMASCRRRCACGRQNKPPDTNARRKVVSGRDEQHAVTSVYVLLRKVCFSAGIRGTLRCMIFHSNS
jgi:hypothetical protein